MADDLRHLDFGDFAVFLDSLPQSGPLDLVQNEVVIEETRAPPLKSPSPNSAGKSSTRNTPVDDDLIDFGCDFAPQSLPHIVITSPERVAELIHKNQDVPLIDFDHDSTSQVRPPDDAFISPATSNVLHPIGLAHMDGRVQSSSLTSTPIRPAPTVPMHLLDDDLDSSRSTVANHPETIGSVPGPESCVDCRSNDGGIDFCNVCELFFCNPCWNKTNAHRLRRLAPGSIPHERTDYGTACKVKRVLEPELTTANRAQLHMDDESNSWFGIVRPGGELPQLVDYGRYAALVATLRAERNARIKSSSPNCVEENCYPCITSFVGDTGAGKSTVVKLLIDLNNEKPETFASPVVGAAGNDMPTSADVHLYRDPRSSETRTPILYADCEGFKGGVRTPIASRSDQPSRDRSGSTGALIDADTSTRPRLSSREITWAGTPILQGREYAVTHLYPRLLYTLSDVVVFVMRNPRYV